MSNRTFGNVLDSIMSNRTPTGMGLSSLEAELKAFYSVVAPRAGSDRDSPIGARNSESPYVPQTAICAIVAKIGRMIVSEEPVKSMVVRHGHL